MWPHGGEKHRLRLHDLPLQGSLLLCLWGKFQEGQMPLQRQVAVGPSPFRFRTESLWRSGNGDTGRDRGTCQCAHVSFSFGSLVCGCHRLHPKPDCVLAAKGFCAEAYDSFLDNTYLAGRMTTVRQYLQQHRRPMEELPPPELELVGRYSGWCLL